MYWADENGDILDYPRNEVLEQIEEQGRKQWKRSSGYHQRSLSETAMYRFKMIHGPTLFSRKLATQKVEAALKVKVINIMTALGMPEFRPPGFPPRSAPGKKKTAGYP